MARIRSIKPEFWTDGKMRRMSDSCALFYIGLWNFCDDEGKCHNDGFELSTKMPRFKSQHITKWVQTLFDCGSIQLSTDFHWVSIVHWNHQKIDRPRVPEILKKDIEWLPVVRAGDSTSPRRVLDVSSTTIRRKDRIGKDSICSEPEPVVPEIHTKVKMKRPEFDLEAAYEKYPNRLGKALGIERANKLITTKELYDQFLLAVTNYANYVSSGDIFIKHFSTFVGTAKVQPWKDYINYDHRENSHQRKVLSVEVK